MKTSISLIAKPYFIYGYRYWHISSVDPTKMRDLPLFQIATQLLTTKHPKLFNTYLLREIEQSETVDLQLAKMQKMTISFNLMIKYVTDVSLSVECFGIHN
jgi:hypothetical protein